MSTTTTRGRPVQYDNDAVLQAAVELFWKQGYEGTSMADLMVATGLSKSSIYNAFGSKRDLFDLALTSYQEFMFGNVEAHLLHGSGGLADLHWLVDFQREMATSEVGRNGCLCLNISAELGDRDEAMVVEAAAYRARLRAGYSAVLDRAAEAGEIDGAMITHYANMMLGGAMGIMMLARAGASREELLSYLDSSDVLIESFHK